MRLKRLPEDAFKKACSEQRKISDLIERLQAKLMLLAEQAYENEGNWAVTGDLVHIREHLEDLLGVAE